MKFKARGTFILWDKEKDQALCKFVNGEYETDDPYITNKLKGKYEVVDDGQAKQGDPEGQETEKEQTFAELREEAKAKKIKGYGRMNKSELLEALKEGE